MDKIEIDPQTVLDVANTVFENKGYDQTRLQDIADELSIPVDTLERDYCCTSEIALQIYHAMSRSSLHDVETLEDGTISGRYFTLMEEKLSQLNQHQEAVSGLFALAMRPSGSITASDISPGMSDPMMTVMQELIAGASDKPAQDDDDLALFLYTFHFLVVLFWLYDRTDDKEASHLFTTFLREFVKITRPMLLMPVFRKALSKVSRIMMLVFGGAKIVSPATEPGD